MTEENDNLPYNCHTLFSLCLSGGGHRATLYGLGALMAIVDVGANKRVQQIASVSGGSLVNAVVANRCNFQEVTPEQFARIAKEHFETVTRGVLTTPWIAVLLALVLAPPLILVFLGLLRMLPSPVFTIPVVVVWLCIALLRGILIEILVAKRYFQRGELQLRMGELVKNRTTDDDLWERGTDHVFCATDLCVGAPVYFSTSRGGVVYERESYKRNPWSDNPTTSDSSGVKVSAVLRASAGFPGIPPRRFRANGKNWNSSPGLFSKSSSTKFLSDGGIWNNLATHVLLEDSFCHGVRGSPRHDLGLILCVDASANLRSTTSWDMHIPGWAELKALWRQATISNANTVGPRRANLDNMFSSVIVDRYQHGLFAYPRYPVVNVPLFALPAMLIERLSRLLRLREHFEVKPEVGALDPALWNRALTQVVLVSEVYKAIQVLSSRRHLWKRSVDVFRAPHYVDLSAICGQVFPLEDPLLEDHNLPLYLDNKDMSDIIMAVSRDIGWFLDDQYHFQAIRSDRVLTTPTTLGAIDKDLARLLVGRGYANASVTLFMLGLSDTLPSPFYHHAWLARPPDIELPTQFEQKGLRVVMDSIDYQSHMVAALNGVATNTTDKVMETCLLQFDLIDAKGVKLAESEAYTRRINPSQQWRFRARFTALIPILGRMVVRPREGQITFECLN